MNIRKMQLAELRSQEKIQEMRDGLLSPDLDEGSDYYYDDERDNYEEYLRNQELEKLFPAKDYEDLDYYDWDAD